jgi:exportin-T
MTLEQDSPNHEIQTEACELLNQTLPVMLRFMADEYDDTSSTVFPFLSVVLNSVRNMICIDPVP